MTTRVFILAAIRKPELAPYAELVFKTLRVGFPEADVTVFLNGDRPIELSPEVLASLSAKQVEEASIFSRVKDLAENCGCAVKPIAECTHHEWIERLIDTEAEPFWICDTDIIFYAPVEGWKFEKPLAGALIPEFDCPFLKAITRRRLHTSLMHICPLELKVASLKYHTNHPRTIYNPPANLVHPLYLPLNGRTYFYDTMAMAYHALGGEAFTPQQKDCYFHFHFGSFSDLVLPAVGKQLEIGRTEILHHHELGIGMWRAQEEWFSARQFEDNGTDVIAPISDKDAEEARRWNVELCQGNQAAMMFCDLWYRYCHGIDDLIDTLQDGRPRMSKEQMMSLFLNAALLYNTEFYIRNREMLCPVVLLVTNTYMDSIAWERSPKKHLRAMADVFRTCGNEMYVMVALICGGEAHMRKMSLAIKERDWLGQHDEAGNPV